MFPTSLATQAPRPVELMDPSQLQSLADLRQQYQQNATMGPIRAQQGQLAVQQGQLQVQQMQRDADTAAISAQAWKDARAQAAAQGQTPTTSTPATAPPAPDPGTMQSGTALQASSPDPYGTPKSPDMADNGSSMDVDRFGNPIAPAPAASSTSGMSSLGPAQSPAAPGFTPQSAPTPAPVPPAAPAQPTDSGRPALIQRGPLPSVEQLYLQNMTAAGRGPEGAKQVNELAIARENQLKLQDMQRQDNDQNIFGTTLQKAQQNAVDNGTNLDMEQVLRDAFRNGMSPIGVSNTRMQMNTWASADAERRLKQSEAASKAEDLTKQRRDDFAADARIFVKNHPDDPQDPNGLQQSWTPFYNSQQQLGRLTDQEYRDHGGKNPPPTLPQLQEMIANHTSTKAGEAMSLTELNRLKALEANRTQNLNTLAGAASVGPAAWQKTLSDTGVDPKTVPAQFDANGVKIPGALDQLNSMAQTPGEKVTMKDAQARLAQQTSYENQMTALKQKEVDNSPNGQAAVLRPMMNKVWTDTLAAKAAGGVSADKVTPEDAVAYLKDTGRWANDPNIPNYRTDLIAKFGTMGKKELDEQLTQAHIDASKGRLTGAQAIQNEIFPDKPKPNPKDKPADKPKTFTGPTQPNPDTTAADANQPKPGSPFRLNLPAPVTGADGKVYDSIDFTDEASATKWMKAHGLVVAK